MFGYYEQESGGELGLLVENMGRTNYQPIDKQVLNTQRKGTVYISFCPILSAEYTVSA